MLFIINFISVKSKITCFIQISLNLNIFVKLSVVHGPHPTRNGDAIWPCLVYPIDSVQIIHRNLIYSAFNGYRKMFQSVQRKQRKFLEKGNVKMELRARNVAQSGFNQTCQQQQQHQSRKLQLILISSSLG